MKKMVLISILLSLALAFPAFAATTGSTSSSEAGALAIAGGASFESPQQYLQGTPIIPNPIPLIQGGRVGDVTGQVVDFAIAAKPYTKGERVVKVLDVKKGSIFGRVRLEDIEKDLLSSYADVCSNNKVNPSQIRYIVQYKDSAMGAGIGGGGQAGTSFVSPTSGVQGGGAILPGYTRSTADPMYIIKWFLVE